MRNRKNGGSGEIVRGMKICDIVDKMEFLSDPELLERVEVFDRMEGVEIFSLFSLFCLLCSFCRK